MDKKETIAVFGGGCFWCTEAVFTMLRGVSSVMPGYSGGATENPTYYDVSRGDTGHVECIKLEFDLKEISYEDLLKVFFASHNPLTLNRQGNDVGTQYASVIFYSTMEQKRIAEKFIEKLNASSKFGKPIVTKVLPLGQFYEAEDYHREYFERNSEAPYCEIVINPKLQKIQMELPDLLKTYSKENRI